MLGGALLEGGLRVFCEGVPIVNSYHARRARRLLVVRDAGNELEIPGT